MTKLKFENLYQQTDQYYQKVKRQSNQIALLRFIFGIGMIAFLCIGYFQSMGWLYGVSLACLICFLGLIRYHDHIKADCLYHESLGWVYQQHIQRMANQWDDFEWNGQEFLDEKDYKATDLDILSQHSLFQMMNLAFTKRGQQKFAEILLHDDIEVAKVHQRQEAVQEMAQYEDFVCQIQAFGHMVHHQQEDMIHDFVKQPRKSYVSITPLIFIVSLLTICSLLCLLFSIGTPYAQVVFEIGAVSQFCFAMVYYRKHQDLFEPVASVNKGLQSYLKIFQLIDQMQFQSSILRRIHSDICQDGEVVEAIQKLSRISQRISYRQNIFAIIFLNALGLFDFWLRNQYLSWLNKYQDHLSNWFEGLADIETYMSLSVLKIDDFDVVMPEVVSYQTLSFQNLRHPLIDPQKVVGNQFKMHGSICVITGSNMSGKTTFMRTVGLNLVLAYAGGFVFAEHLQCSPMHIMTSMRVKDNVEEGISTFYGELLRIKDMLTYSAQQRPMLCLIDEIFKGTNSLDRIAGAKATMKKLSLPYAMAFLTTHDFELCQIDGIDCQNYHFDEYYQDEHIYFDYLMKEGRSQSTNGQFLLKQLGILE